MTASERSLPPLTKRQREVLDCIEAGLLLDGMAPSVEEIAQVLKLTKSTVAEHIDNLVSHGWLERAGAPGEHRTLRPTQTVEALLRERVAELQTRLDECKCEEPEV